MRTDEIVIGLSDECDRNYSLDRSRLGLYYAKKLNPVPDGRTHMAYNDGAPKDLFQAIAGSTACSSMVFFGLLAWANLNAHMPSNALILEDCRRDRLADG